VDAATVEETASVEGVISWRPLAEADLPMLTEWLREPQVARWWNHDTSRAGVERDFGPSVRGEEPGQDLVVLLEDRPVGLLQRSRIADYPEEAEEFAALVDVPTGAVELDYLIGDPSLRGRGLGARMIAEAVADTWRTFPDTPAVLVAVVAANLASWRALEKAGLTRVAEGEMTPDNPVDDPLHFVYRIDRPGTVLEVALMDVTDADGFAAAYGQAREILAGAPGCRSVRMTRGIESPERFVLLVEWDSVEAHEVNFRQTDRFTSWRGLIGPYFSNPPRVEHFTDVVVG
jgi:aminoglycoside 6'-N-acetyltransferase